MGFANERIEDKKIVLRDFADKDKTAVVSFGNCRQRGFRQPLPRTVYGAGLQLQFLRATQDLLHTDSVAILMRELPGIDGDAMKAQHERQNGKTCGMGDWREFGFRGHDPA